MKLNINIEYYPNIKENLKKESLDYISNNIDKWDAPFFTDTKSNLNLENIKQISQHFLNNNLKNIIVLGTGGSIQTLLALKHLSKKRIFSITSSRAVELQNCLEKTTPEDSVVIPISRGGETLDVNSAIGIFLKKGYNFIGLSSKGSMNDMLKEIGCPILDS